MTEEMRTMLHGIKMRMNIVYAKGLENGTSHCDIEFSMEELDAARLSLMFLLNPEPFMFVANKRNKD